MPPSRFISSRLVALTLAISAAALAPAAAQAQSKVLFLTTTETHSIGVSFVNNARSAFSAAAAAKGATFVDRTSALGNDTLTDADFADVDVAVITTVYTPVTAANMSVIRNQMLNNPKLRVIAFADGCCSETSNLGPMVDIVNTGFASVSMGGRIVANIASPRNDASPYASGFSANPMRGDAYRLINGVPRDYALYLSNGATVPPATPTVNAYAMLVPQKRFNQGKGACVFLTADSNVVHQVPQANALASDFLTAALDPAGVCSKGAAEPDLKPTLTGPANLTLNTPATYTLKVDNIGLAASAAATPLTVTLPAGLSFDGTPPAGCTVAGATMTCNALPAIAPGADSSLSFQVKATNPGGPLDINVNVNATTGEIVTANNVTKLSVSAASTAAVPVPTLGHGSLMLMGLAAAGLGARRLRRKA